MIISIIYDNFSPPPQYKNCSMSSVHMPIITYEILIYMLSFTMLRLNESLQRIIKFTKSQCVFSMCIPLANLMMSPFRIIS